MTIFIPQDSELSLHAKHMLNEFFNEHPGLRPPTRVREYSWKTLCLKFNLQENGDKEKQRDSVNDEFSMVWDTECDTYITIEFN